MLVSIEGIDGAGKTTVAERMRAEMAKVWSKVVVTREPTDGPWGREIRARAVRGVRSGPSVFLLDRRDHLERVIQPALATGAVVLADRYVHSTAAYQGRTVAATQFLLEGQRTWAAWPDLTVWLDVPVEVAVARIAQRGVADAYERAADLQLARDGYARCAELDPVVVRVDADAPLDVVVQQALNAVAWRISCQA